jgi:hypothetical protein
MEGSHWSGGAAGRLPRLKRTCCPPAEPDRACRSSQLSVEAERLHADIVAARRRSTNGDPCRHLRARPHLRRGYRCDRTSPSP